MCSTRSTTYFAKREKSDNIAAMDTFYQRAYSLISSQKAREAFNIDAEPAKIRDEYGRNPAGQRMLDGPPAGGGGRAVRDRRVRRLGLCTPRSCAGMNEPDAGVRPGVRRLDPRPRSQRPAQPDDGHGLQRVRPHAKNQQGCRPRPLAQGVQRGSRGRRHQDEATSMASSNATASEPEHDPIGPEDLATTVYHQLGIVADKELMAPGNRPIEIVNGGKVVKELLA